MSSLSPLTLVADVGGTNTRLALADASGLLTETVHREKNANHGDLYSVLRSFLTQHPKADIGGVAVAVAGPVRNNAARMTNLNWEIDPDDLCATTGAARAVVMNDMQAQGYGLDHLSSGAVTPLISGKRNEPEGNRLVVGLGTGLNIAPVLRTGVGTMVTPSETGHITLPVLNARHFDLAQHLSRTYDRAPVEEALSGRGLAAVHGWNTGQSASDIAPADVIAAAQNGHDAKARDSVAVFVELLGTVVGDLALVQLPYGGIYFIGGVARALTPFLSDQAFADAFHAKGRFSYMLQDFNVSLVDDDFAALAGLAGHMAQLSTD